MRRLYLVTIFPLKQIIQGISPFDNISVTFNSLMTEVYNTNDLQKKKIKLLYIVGMLRLIIIIIITSIYGAIHQ